MGFDTHAHSSRNCLDLAVTLGTQQRFHLHRLDREQRVSALDPLALLHADTDDAPGHWCGNVLGIVRFCLRVTLDEVRATAVHDIDGTRLAIELEKDASLAFVIDIAHAQQTDNEPFAALELNFDFLVRPQSVEEDRRRQHANVSVAALNVRELLEYGRIEQIGAELLIAQPSLDAFLGLRALGVEVRRRHECARALCQVFRS